MLIHSVITTNTFSELMVAFVLITILTLFFLINKLKSNLKKFRMINEMKSHVLASMTPGQSVEKHLNQYLEMIMAIIKAEGYYFYLFDPKSRSYVLRVSRQAGPNPGQIEPNYSGLAPYNKEIYHPPFGLSEPKQSKETSLVKDGEVPLVELMVSGEEGLIRIGPVREVTKEVKFYLDNLGEALGPVITMLLALEKQTLDSQLLLATSRAMNGLAKSNFDVDSMWSRMVYLGANLLGAQGCCIFIDQGEKFEAQIMSGLDQEVKNQLKMDQDFLSYLYHLSEEEGFYRLSRNKEEYNRVPFFLVASGLKTIVVFKASGRTFKGMAIFLNEQEVANEQHRIGTLKILLRRLASIYDQRSKYRGLAESYIWALRALLDATDNIEAHTVGHSNLIANYSAAIATELELSRKDIQEIKLAGYFHDVGMIGLNSDILFKPGAFTPLEYDMMKLHTEVGAAISESVIGNSNVTSYIRHHHERWDGYGYPQGHGGEEIPLGARIIAVADMFNAKLGGRKYRDPVPFERAVKDMTAAAGTQLDPGAVEALLNWFRKKQADPKRKSRTLGPCWEMRCCPSPIHKNCIVYNSKADKNCWEFEGVNCTAHGNICATCFIRTEALFREDQKYSVVSNS